MTTTGITLLSILLPLFFILVLSFFLVNFTFSKKIKKTKSVDQSGIILVQIEMDKNRLRLINPIWNSKIINNTLDYVTNSFFKSGWNDLDVTLNNLPPKEREKWLSNLESVSINKKNTSFTSKIKLNSRINEYSFWKITLIYRQDAKIDVNIKWINRIENKKKPNIIDKNTLLDDGKIFKIFISFNLLNDDEEMIKNFIYNLQKLLKNKKLEFLVSKNVVSVVLKSNNFHLINKEKEQIINKIEKTMLENYISNFYDGLSIVDAKDIKSASDINKVFSRISFGLLKSKTQQRKTFYFELKSIYYSEFEDFKFALNNINQIVVSNKISIKESSVINSVSNKEEYNLLLPSPNFEDQDNIWYELILSSYNFKHLLENVFFKQIIREFDNKNSNVFLNINYELLEDEIKTIKEKDFIYIIDCESNSVANNLPAIINLIERNQFKFALRVKNFNSVAASIINVVKPQAIFIDCLIASKNDLKLLASILENLKINIVYENIKQLEDKNKQVIKKSKYNFYL